MKPERPRILAVDDEENIRDLVKAYLEREGYAVSLAEDGEGALLMAGEIKPHIVILDLMLPGIDGLDVCRELRQKSDDTYILMLTARAEESDRVLGLTEGADDYLVKPFRPRELVARVKAMLRRIQKTPGIIKFGDLIINPEARVVKRDGRSIELSALQFDLLLFLAGNAGIVLSRQQIIDQVWGYDWTGDERLVDVHIGNLRKKIEPDPNNPRYIQTVRGVGYCFSGDSP